MAFYLLTAVFIALRLVTLRLSYQLILDCCVLGSRQIPFGLRLFLSGFSFSCV